MKELQEAIKTVLAHGLGVTDFWHDMYWANGEMGHKPGDPTPYIIGSQDDVEPVVYEEHEEIDDAVQSFLKHVGRTK